MSFRRASRNDTARTGRSLVLGTTRTGPSLGVHTARAARSLVLRAARGAARRVLRSRGMRLTPLERRALNDLALRTGCSPSDPFACCESCWSRWLRARLVQHVRRERCWEELDDEAVRQLQRGWQEKDHVVAEVVARIAAGAETLTVLTWAVDAQRPLEDVVAVLRVFDGIGRRVPRFAWMSPATACRRT